MTPRPNRRAFVALISLVGLAFVAPAQAQTTRPAIWGITGSVTDVAVLPSEPSPETGDIDLQRMAAWAMNYLQRTPRVNLGYEPVFQCHPLQCPPVPAGQDPVVACDTDARMDWEWYYMRDVSGSDAGRDVEAAFHKRIWSYVGKDGLVRSTPGAFNEGDTTVRYQKKDEVLHIWGATKVLMSLAEHHARHHDAESKRLGREVMLGLKRLATWEADGKRCYFRCGMGALREDGSVVPNGWNRQPAPIVEPLVTYWLVTHDDEALAFARAYADGMIAGSQPDGIRFNADGSVGGGPHSHATMHAVWGVAHLGVATGEARYVEFAKRVWDWMLTRGTGTGWFPAGPDNCNETCCISDMTSIAALLGRAGHAEYYDAVERYLRNYISPLQFELTPAFETYYRKRNAGKPEPQIAAGLAELAKFQGGVIGGSGLNDFENTLLGGASGFEMFGCCAPEGMRAIHTAWSNTIEHRDAADSRPAGVYVNLSFNRDSQWGRVTSSLPGEGRLSVTAATDDAFFLRRPSWAPKSDVRGFVDGKAVSVKWAGDYVRFDGVRRGEVVAITYPVVRFTQSVAGLWKGCAPDLRMTFHWRGNTVIDSDPKPQHTPLFTATPRKLPEPPR